MNYQRQVETVDRECSSFVRAKLGSGTVAHGIDHLQPVAQYTELMGIAAGFSDRELVISRPGGWLHDFVRTLREDNRIPDEEVSAKVAVKFLRGLSRDGVFPTTRTERTAVAYAIRSHRTPPDFFTDGTPTNNWTLRQKAAAALFAADKIEQNGYWVIARRSAFIGGAKLQEGDLKEFKPRLTPDKAVLAESAIRLTFINPQNIYPDVFAPIVAPLYGVQRDFVHGLMNGLNMNTRDLARMLLSTKNKAGESLLTSRKNIKAPDSVEELMRNLEEVGGLSNREVLYAMVELHYAAGEAVAYFSSNYQEDLSEKVKRWEPISRVAKTWKQGMLDYRCGEWFAQARRTLMEFQD